MIVREAEHEFVMVRQDDHARVSGEIARYFNGALFGSDRYVNDVLQAVAEHDRGWIRMDDTPIWNDKERMPFTFNDYPLLPKLAMYQLGIEEVERNNPYAALLCSLHYASFPIFRQSDQPACVEFHRRELERQAAIKHQLGLSDEAMIRSHFQILQLCDDFSLYICLNRPGAANEEEHPWYRNGFKNSELLTGDLQNRIVAQWVNEKAIRISPSPFRESFSLKLKLKRVAKERIEQLGIGDAYKQTEWEEQEFTFLS